MLLSLKAEGKYEEGLSEHTIGHFLGGIKRASHLDAAGHYDLAAEELAWASRIAERDNLGSDLVKWAKGMAIEEYSAAAVMAFGDVDMVRTCALITNAEKLLGELRRDLGDIQLAVAIII